MHSKIKGGGIFELILHFNVRNTQIGAMPMRSRRLSKLQTENKKRLRSALFIICCVFLTTVTLALGLHYSKNLHTKSNRKMSFQSMGGDFIFVI